MSVFDGINFTTPEGAALKRRLEEKLSGLRERNDNQDLTPTQTAEVRGRIAQLKELLQSPAKVQPIQSYYNNQEG